MFEFRLPDIGEGLHEAELLAWDVNVGDTVAEGESIAQISTDKVNVELPSPRAGTITELPWNIGDVIPVGEVLARIDDGSEAVAEAPREETTSSQAPAAAKAERPTVKAPPVVKRYAAEKGVDLGQVTATGPGGMATRADVDAYLSGNAGEAPVEDGVTRLALSGPRLAAAKRLEESWRTLATTAMAFEVEADAILARVEAGTNNETPLSVITEGLCHALGQHPNFNAVVDEGARALDIHDSIHLGIAVDSPDGLLVPVLRDAGNKSAGELVQAIGELAEKARAGQLAVSDFKGSTFTLSSTGSLEKANIIATTPVINYPNVATLWVSRISDRPRVRDGVLEAGPMMNCTLAFDHRFLHGADATRFINDFCASLPGSSSRKAE